MFTVVGVNRHRCEWDGANRRSVKSRGVEGRPTTFAPIDDELRRLNMRNLPKLLTYRPSREFDPRLSHEM